MFYFLVLLVIVATEGPLVGLSMHNLLQITDLEYDIVNPHDASKAVNRTVPYILYLQAALTAALLLGWYWYLLPFHALYLWWKVRLHRRGMLETSPTDIYRDIKALRMRMFRDVGFHLFSFCIVLFLFVLHIVMSIDDKSGASKTIREVAADLGA